MIFTFTSLFLFDKKTTLISPTNWKLEDWKINFEFLGSQFSFDALPTRCYFSFGFNVAAVKFSTGNYVISRVTQYSLRYVEQEDDPLQFMKNGPDRPVCPFVGSFRSTLMIQIVYILEIAVNV